MATWASLLDVLERNWDLSAEVQAARARPPQRHAARLREAGSPPNRRVELVWGFGFEAVVEGKWETPEDLTTPNQFGKLGETRDEVRRVRERQRSSFTRRGDWMVVAWALTTDSLIISGQKESPARGEGGAQPPPRPVESGKPSSKSPDRSSRVRLMR